MEYQIIPWNFHQNQNQFQWIIWKVKYLWSTKSGIIHEFIFYEKKAKRPIKDWKYQYLNSLANYQMLVIPIIVSPNLIKVNKYVFDK